ncbi:MAG: electron transfer flavoprotein subunit beta/FixA family protein [Caldilineaceae bacterium]|nr:electron transfer flavoprotein subunit beta/FixA family protein [Caldilineaceae bacterium]
MKIAVLIKQTPDTAELPKVSAEEVKSGDVNATMVINPWDEYAAEEALLLDDRFGAGSVALSMGSEDATDALKHALAMGIGEAVLIDSSALGDADMWTTAAALAAAVKEQGDVELVLTGKQSVDGNSGALFAGVACKLGWSLLTNVAKIVDMGDGFITVERMVDGGQETVQAPLPAVVSVAKEINDPRYPSFMGIRKANRANIPVLTAADLGVSDVSATEWANIRKPEQVETEVVIIEGDSVAEKAAKLADAIMAEKVI